MRLGRHAEALPELERLVREEPLRERPHGQLMLALYRAGRQADALSAYRRARSVLGEELGLEPGPELRALELAILRQDPALDVEPAELRERRRLPAPATPLIGRRRQVDEVTRSPRGRRAARDTARAGRDGEDADRPAGRIRTGRALPRRRPVRRPGPAARSGARRRTGRGGPRRRGRRARANTCASARCCCCSTTSSRSTAPRRSSPRCCGPRPACAASSPAGARCALYGEHAYDVGAAGVVGRGGRRCSSPARRPWGRAWPPRRRSPRSARRSTACRSRSNWSPRAPATSTTAEMVALPERAGARGRRPARPARPPADARGDDRVEPRPARRAAALPLRGALGVRRRLGRGGRTGGGGRRARRSRRALRPQPDPARRRALHDARDDPRVRRPRELPDEVRERHAAHVLDLAERADRELREGGDQVAVARAPRSRARQRPRGARLVRGRPRRAPPRRRAGELLGRPRPRRRGLERGERALGCPGSPAERAKALAGTSVLAWARGQHERSRALAEEALDLYRALDDGPGMVRALANLGFAATATGDLVARPLLLRGRPGRGASGPAGRATSPSRSTASPIWRSGPANWRVRARWASRL